MMRVLPLVRDHRPAANLDDNVANSKARFFSHTHEVAMCPLRPMIVHHIGDLCEQQTVRLQDSFSLLEEGRI